MRRCQSCGLSGWSSVHPPCSGRPTSSLRCTVSRPCPSVRAQVLRHVHGFTAVRYAGLPSGHDTQPTDAVMRRFERMLKTFEKEHGLQVCASEAQGPVPGLSLSSPIFF